MPGARIGFLRSPLVAEAAICCERRSRSRYLLRWNKHQSEHFLSRTTFGGGRHSPEIDRFQHLFDHRNHPLNETSVRPEAENARGPKKHNRCMLLCAEGFLRWGMFRDDDIHLADFRKLASRTRFAPLEPKGAACIRVVVPASPPARIERYRTPHCPLAIGVGTDARRAHPIKSCDYWPLKRLSLIAFEHIGTQEIRGMLILVCALTLALAIGACVGGLMVRLRADKVAVVRRDAVSGQLNTGASPSARRRPRGSAGQLEEPPASRS